MAPKGGRGGGSRSSGGSGGSSSDSVWLSTGQLPGSRFENHYVAAGVVIETLAWIALFGIFIWWRMSSKRRAIEPKALKLPFTLSFFSAVASYFLICLNDILTEAQATVALIYIIEPILGLFFAFVFQILLVFVIFKVIAHRLEGGKNSLSKGLTYFAAFLCLILTALAIASLYFYIAYLVKRPGSIIYQGIGVISNNYSKLIASFYILLWIASIVILGAAAYIFVQSRTSAPGHKGPLFLLTLVAIPFFIANIVSAALNIHYNLEEKVDYNGDKVFLVQIILSTIPMVIVYFGLSLIGLKPDAVMNHSNQPVGPPIDPVMGSGPASSMHTGTDSKPSQSTYYPQQPMQQHPQQWNNGQPQPQQWNQYPQHPQQGNYNGAPAQQQQWTSPSPVHEMPHQQQHTQQQWTGSSPVHEMPQGPQQQATMPQQHPQQVYEAPAQPHVTR